MLHQFAQTYSSCVEQPVQCLFFAIAAVHNYLLFSGNGKDAYAHSPPPATPTFVAIDDKYADWWYINLVTLLIVPKSSPFYVLFKVIQNLVIYGNNISPRYFSPSFQLYYNHAWSSHLSWLFWWNSHFLLWQVDDFVLAIPFENTAVKIYTTIGE